LSCCLKAFKAGALNRDNGKTTKEEYDLTTKEGIMPAFQDRQINSEEMLKRLHD
jgi:hypothetical protein